MRVFAVGCMGLAERGVEAEPNVVSGPVSVGITEDGFEQGDGGSECGRAISWVEAVENSIAEGVEP
jgi:hypothetical protein